jgi:isoamylase
LSSIRDIGTRTARRRSIADIGIVAQRGRPQPLGATVDDAGVNFSVFSEDATAVQLLLFDEFDDTQPIATLDLSPDLNRSFHFWHLYVRGLRPGYHYAWRADGPKDLHPTGHRFDPQKVLLDPYARGATNTLWDRGAACMPGDNLATSMRAVIVDTRDYDWEGDKPLGRPLSESVIYEMHVRGFTKHPSSGVEHPGTFAGVIEKIPYLQELGVTAVELLPVFAFDEKEVLRAAPDGTLLTNYWGYDPILHFAPEATYCVNPEEGAHIREFRDMVKALHKAGIEVILDVVFNHTGEGNHMGPTISLKGFENDAYYLLSPQDKQYYMDYSGCGNTVNANHPIVEKFIVDCLKFWVRELHVDGFRFDEGSILHRGPSGAPMDFPPVVWGIELEEELSDTKMIAEPWDAGGLYDVGRFPGARWSEWNGKFRDDVRRFVKGDTGLVPTIATRMSGSQDIYGRNARGPVNSVNFVTAHDGFTLNDLVSYNQKHNEANGEGNRDGNDQNDSWNHGVEGPTDNPAIEALRNQQVKNFAAILLLSQGVPMFVAGDEVRRTQHGNNNAYCQDNEISWFDWRLVEEHRDVFRFFRNMIALRRRHRSLQRRDFFTGKPNSWGVPDVIWHGCKLNAPPWHDPSSHVLAFTLAGIEATEPDLHVMLNMDAATLDFELPKEAGKVWRVFADTSKPAPEDITEVGEERPFTGETYAVEGHSVVILVSADD